MQCGNGYYFRDLQQHTKLTFPTFYIRLKTIVRWNDGMLHCFPSLFKIYPMLPKKSLQHILYNKILLIILKSIFCFIFRICDHFSRKEELVCYILLFRAEIRLTPVDPVNHHLQNLLIFAAKNSVICEVTLTSFPMILLLDQKGWS